jgi:hypothetical protein
LVNGGGRGFILCQYSKAQNMVWALHTNGVKEVLFKKVLMANNLALIMYPCDQLVRNVNDDGNISFNLLHIDIK